MSLSARWAARSHRALAGSTSTIQRLAVALGPVRSIIRVVDDHVPPLTVDWARVGKDTEGRSLSMSYTNFASGRIAINPLPIFELEKGGDPAHAIDIVTGLAVHEAGHGKSSRDRYETLIERVLTTIPTQSSSRGRTADIEKPVFRPLRVAAYLLNLVEDVRSEAETVQDWPGFGPYLDAVLGWVWKDMEDRRDFPLGIASAHTVADRIRIAFLACRYPDKVIQPRVLDDTPRDRAEVAWWQAWQADYLSGMVETRETIKRGMDHLAEDGATKDEMADMQKAEERDQQAGEKLRAQIERLIREGIKGAYEVCIGSEGETRPLTSEEADAVDKLVREGFIAFEPTSFVPGADCAEVRVSKPEETWQSRAAYVGKPDATVEALRAALVFRQSLPRYDVKLQKSGDIDDEELYRHSMNDYRLFTERVIEGRPDTLLAMLVDLSGSMSWGYKLPVAQRLAQLMLWALHDQEGVTTRVWGHTGDSNGDGSDIYRLWEPGDPMSRLGLVNEIDHGNNYDGFAIQYCLSQMVDEPQPQRVLVVLSDGLPAGHHYGREPAQRHMRLVTDWGRRQGIQTLQIAIDEDLRPEDQAAMFGAENVIPYVSEGELPRQLTKVLSRWT